jgi:outer membrane scaffolding protein for murein synthesis (MipA/OmpV family)
MFRHLLALPVLLGLAACVEETGPSEAYAFVGSWDCGVEVFTFTNTTYNNGDTTYPILSVSRNGRDFILRFANGYTIALAAVTETGLTWISGASGDQFNCRRVN